MSNLDYSLPTNGLHHLIPRIWSGSGRFAIFSGESLPVVVVVVAVVVVVVILGVVIAVVEALELLQPRGKKLVKSAHLGRRRNKRQRGG